MPTPGPHLRRGPFPCAGPGRGGPPAAAARARSGACALRRARPPGLPPGSSGRPVCAAVRLRGRSLGSRARGPALRGLRAPCGAGRPCPASCVSPGPSVPSPVPPWPVPFGASGAACSRGRGLGGFAAVPVALPPAPFFCSRAAPGPLPVSPVVRLPGALRRPLGSPLRPSRPRRPAGAPGKRVACGWGLRPPLLRSPPGLVRCCQARAPSHCSGGGQGSGRAQVCALALAAALFLAQGLDKGEHLRYYLCG